jgi:hypothetical protein
MTGVGQTRAIGSVVRALGSHPRGHWFESSIAHHLSSAVLALVIVVCALPVNVARAAVVDDVNSLGLTATYEVEADFRWDARTADVRTRIDVANDVRWPVSTLAFNLATLRTGRARIDVLDASGARMNASTDDQTILVPLLQPLVPGETIQLSINYTARLNATSTADGDEWEFAQIDDVLTAYRWIPWLSRPTPFDRPNVGDPFVTATSPHVRVAITVDRDVTIAGTGVRVADEGGAQIFEATDVRDFNLAASPAYQSASVDVGGVSVTFFYLTLPAPKVLDIAARAMRTFSQQVGPYPHDHLTIAEIGPWSPFESPAHFWLPAKAPARLLDWMVAHEVAHQWFYSAVGNDQAREPFADEALADYMARSLINRFVSSPCPENRLDHSIYDISDCYPWVVYVQGDAWLRRLESRAGGARFWSAIAAYFATHRGRMGGTYELVAALAARVGDEAIDYERFPATLPPRVISLPFRAALT